MTNLAPFLKLWRAEKRRHAETQRRLKECEFDLAAHSAHFLLACDQRDKAIRAMRRAEAYADELRAQLASWMDDRAGVAGEEQGS